MTINYPFKKQTTRVVTRGQNVISKSNMGMKLENILNETNEYYRMHNIAVIYKKPIPIQIVKVDYPNREHAKITEAYYKIPSTTDYNGIYKGFYVDFEAKESNSKTSFPLRNIHPHQIEHLRLIKKQGGIGFIIFYFAQYDEYYVMKLSIVLKYWDDIDGRKSIPYAEFKQNGFLIKESYSPRLDYLKAWDYLLND